MKSAPPPLSVNVRFYPQQNQHIRDKTSKSCRKYAYPMHEAKHRVQGAVMEDPEPAHLVALVASVAREEPGIGGIPEHTELLIDVAEVRHLEELRHETKAGVPCCAEKPGRRGLRIAARIDRVTARACPDRAVTSRHALIRLRNAAVDAVEELTSRLLVGSKHIVEWSMWVWWVGDVEDEVGECLRSTVRNERISPQQFREPV